MTTDFYCACLPLKGSIAEIAAALIDRFFGNQTHRPVLPNRRSRNAS
jgi:hypothetical protein